MKKSVKYLKLFVSTLKLSACTFGGGFVIIPLMRRKFVEDLHWLEEDEMMDLAAIAQSAPGAIAVNASVLVGYKTAGILGALISTAGTVLPPLVIISVISLFYTAFRDNAVVSLVMSGMLCGVAAVIFDVVIRMAGEIISSRKIRDIAVLAAAFAAVRFFNVSSIIVILVCAALGGLETVWERRAGHLAAEPEKGAVKR